MELLFFPPRHVHFLRNHAGTAKKKAIEESDR
jgi:hypothetical protein